MTDTYNDRLERLRAAGEGDTVTVPKGWTPPPSIADRLEGLLPGDVFTNDGDSEVEWRLGVVVGSRRGLSLYSDSTDLAFLGLDVDGADEPGSVTADGYAVGGFMRFGELSGDGVALDENTDEVDEPVSCGCGTCEAIAAASGNDDETDDDGAPLRHCPCDACEPDDDDAIGTVSVRVVPDTSGFAEALADAVPDHVKYRLDEYQRERVAAAEQALRLLESRRGPQGGTAGVFGNIAGTRAEVPMVGTRSLIDVAAFIADGDTGRTEVPA